MGSRASGLKALATGMCVFGVAALTGAPVYSMDGVFDREAEVQSYLPAVEAGTRREFIQAAQKIYMSGIGDARLAQALAARLRKEAAGLDAPKLWHRYNMNAVVVEDRYINETDAGYGLWLIQAPCSTGSELVLPALNEMASRRKGAQLKELRKQAAFCANRLAWHRKKNELMASRQHHQPGDDPQVSRLVNLLHADDKTYRDFVYDYISANKIREPRYFDVIRANILAALQAPPVASSEKRAPNKTPNKTLIQELKMLGDSNDRSNATVLQRVLDSNVDVATKKHAQAALSRLQ
jgi:hypothetical protein